jgi:hypothetical protein
MSNLISWGDIYCSTWWGDTDRTTLSIQNESAPPCFAPINDIAIAFRERVEADGGVLEGYNCLVAALQDLGEDNYYELFDTYIQRMTDDGATLEGRDCLIEQLFNLN